MSPHLCEILIAILSVHPSITFWWSKKQQTYKSRWGETSTVGGKRPVSGWNVLGAKCPGGRNVLVASKGRNVNLQLSLLAVFIGGNESSRELTFHTGTFAPITEKFPQPPKSLGIEIRIWLRNMLHCISRTPCSSQVLGSLWGNGFNHPTRMVLGAKSP